MPGFSEACESSCHAQCAEPPGQCRCICHNHTKELMRRGPAKPSGKGGVRRKIKMPNVPAVPQQPMHLIAEREPEAEETELHNSCPKCRTRWTPTDVFCRK